MQGATGIFLAYQQFMRSLFTLFCTALLILLPQAVQAQTVIELDRGGNVRNKTIDDYKEENGMAERQRADSLQYVDHLRRAFNALHSDSLTEAENYFNNALKLRPHAPGNHVVRFNLAQISRARAQYLPALKQLNDLIKEIPNYYDARLARAEINLELGNAREAIVDAEVLINNDALKQIDPDLQLKSVFVRAAAYYRAHRYVEARADIHRLLQVQPNNVNAQILEALTLQKMGQPKEALNTLNRIVSANPSHMDALLTRATLHLELGMTASARADYDQLITLSPKDGNLYVERARTLIKLNDKSAARRDLDTALSLGIPRGMVQALYNLLHP